MQKLLATIAIITMLVCWTPDAHAQSPSLASQNKATFASFVEQSPGAVSYGKSVAVSILATRHIAQHDLTGIAQPTPTSTPTPTPTLLPTRAPMAKAPVAAPAFSLNADLLFDMSNAHRAGLGLPPFIKDETLCELARSRAPEIHAEVAGGSMHQGLADRAIPFWITENIVTMSHEEAAFGWWSTHGIHKAALESGNTHSCVACHGIACAQEFTSWVAK